MTDSRKAEDKVVKELTKFVKRAIEATENAYAFAYRVNEDSAQQQEMFRELVSKTSAALDSLRKGGLVLGRHVVERLDEAASSGDREP